MTTEELDQLASILSARLEAVTKEQFAEVFRRLQSIQQVVDIQTGNTDEDRKDFAQMKINQASIDQGVKELVGLIQTMSKRTTDKVVDQTNGAIDRAVDKVTESVEPALQRAMNKIRSGIPLGKKEPWWKFWR